MKYQTELDFGFVKLWLGQVENELVKFELYENWQSYVDWYSILWYVVTYFTKYESCFASYQEIQALEISVDTIEKEISLSKKNLAFEFWTFFVYYLNTLLHEHCIVLVTLKSVLFDCDEEKVRFCLYVIE